MRSRRRKGRRNRDGLWICGIAVLAAGAVFTARTEILDLVTTEIAFVLDPKQEGGEKESDQDIAERVESTDGGKETLTDGGVDLAETDEAGADPDQKNTDAGTEASGSGNSDPEAIELPSSYDIREHRTVSVSDQGDLGTCWAFAALKAVVRSAKICLFREFIALVRFRLMTATGPSTRYSTVSSSIGKSLL